LVIDHSPYRAALHLFEVFEKSRYVYAGEAELAGEPCMSDQDDARADSRFVWVFPLRRKDAAADGIGESSEPEPSDHLPYGAYAVVRSGLTDEQIDLVNEALDRLKQAGVPVTDQRDIDRKRYDRALARWHEAVLDHVRSEIKKLIAKRKQAAKAQNRTFGLIDDELKINAASTERELRDALRFLDRDDPIVMEEVFEEARRSVPMPDPPKSMLRESTETDPIEITDTKGVPIGQRDPARFRDFT
jgi:hypothetical protein